MIVQCSECQTKLKVDESKLTKDIIRGVCYKCNAVIEVKRPEPPTVDFDSLSMLDDPSDPPQAPLPEQEPSADPGPVASSQNQDVTPSSKRVGGFTVWKKLILLFLAFIAITGGGVTFLYMTYIPSLMHDQVNLRTYSIARSFTGAIQQPLLIKNYLLVNQMAETNAKLPHVAYVSVLNKRGIVIAGIFGDKTSFDQNFTNKIKKAGFPKEISSQNRIPTGAKQSTMDFTVGGQRIHDVAVSIADTGGEVHVGVFTANVEAAVQKNLIPLMGLLAGLVLIGSICFFMVARSISKPIRALTQAAEKISTGELDRPISITGGGEIAELAESLERMRVSISIAVERLKR